MGNHYICLQGLQFQVIIENHERFCDERWCDHIPRDGPIFLTNAVGFYSFSKLSIKLPLKSKCSTTCLSSKNDFTFRIVFCCKPRTSRCLIYKIDEHCGAPLITILVITVHSTRSLDSCTIRITLSSGSPYSLRRVKLSHCFKSGYHWK